MGQAPGVSAKDRPHVSQSRPLDITLDMLVFLAWHVLPWIYIFSTWLDFADYSLPAWAGWIGVVDLARLVLLWKAYHDLGHNWSPKIDIVEGQVLVDSGIYREDPPSHLRWIMAMGCGAAPSLAQLDRRICFPPVLLDPVPGAHAA